MSDLKSVLAAIDSALTVIQTVANTPGINIIPYVSTVSGAISAIKTAAALGQNIIPYVQAIQATFSGSGVPSQDDLDALDAKIKALEAKVDEPLPPKEAGEPD